MQKFKTIKFLFLIVLIFSGCKQNVSRPIENISIIRLRCEMLENPVGIDETKPRLSWNIQSEQRNIQQTAYQILVASSPQILDRNEGDLWNSGKTNSNQSVHVQYKGAPLKSRMRCFWKIKVWSINGESEWSESANWIMGQLNYNAWSGRWIGFDRAFPWDDDSRFSRLSARYFRTEFVPDSTKEIKYATAYIIGLGLYEIYINGEKIGDQVLAPSQTDFTKNVKYNAFDVSTNINKGKNAVGVILGNGRYYNMRRGFKPYKIKDFGFPKLRFNLFIEYTDGTKNVIKTTNQWKGTADGPIRSNNEYDGEEYDARKEMPGWNMPDFNDSNWLNAEYVQEPRGELEAQMNENMKVMDTIQPVAINQIRPGVYVLDIGQNMAGWVKMKIPQGSPGQKIQLKYSEKIKENGEIFTENLRDAKATDIYILDNKSATTWNPRFVYHGFRYVEITGYPGTPTVKDFVGEVVYDNMQTVGSFECSNSLLNQIHKNAYWSIISNYKGMPIDCPQRNERQPWLGDRAASCYGESFLTENSKLYTKWLEDIKNTQKSDGCIADVAPPYFRYYSDNMTWPGTYILVAEMLYNQYGDSKPIEDHYESMKLWLDYMKERYMKDFILTKDSYGDWCPPPKTIEEGMGKSANVKHPSILISTAYYYHYMSIMQKFADITNNQQDINYYQNIADSIKTAFNKEFFNADSFFYGSNSATDNILPLYFGLVPEASKDSVFGQLVHNIMVEHNGHLSSGLVGSQWLLRTLELYGRNDIAYKIANNTTYPSWGYMIKNKATAIWELWNGNTAAQNMNSYNHVMLLGDLMIWYYENLAGIKSAPNSSGFKNIRLNPNFDSDLNFVNAEYNSVYGKIVSNWEKSDSTIQWQITIPPNTTAIVYMPAESADNIAESGHSLKDSYGLSSYSKIDNKIVVNLTSGKYNFLIY